MNRKTGHIRADLRRCVGTDTLCRSTRRRSLLALGACTLLAPQALLAQRSATPVVGVLLGGTPESHAALYEAFKRGMREAGWRDGENVRLEPRWTRGQNERFPQLAEELAGLKPAVIVSASTPGVLAAAKAAGGRIAIVMASGDDPVLLGLAKSFARPGGNVTGTSNLLRDLAGKQIELLRQIRPALKRVGVLINPSSRSNVERFRANEVVYRKVGVSPIVAEASVVHELTRAFEDLRREGVEALIVEADAFFVTQRELIARLAVERKLPTLYPFREFVDSGGLMSYGVSLPYSYHRAAYFVDKLMKGAKPADLPIEQPTMVEMVINLKTARLLGLSISKSLLMRADRMIE